MQPLLVRQQVFARLSKREMEWVSEFLVQRRIRIMELRDVGVRTGPYDIGPWIEKFLGSKHLAVLGLSQPPVALKSLVAFCH